MMVYLKTYKASFLKLAYGYEFEFPFKKYLNLNLF